MRISSPVPLLLLNVVLVCSLLQCAALGTKVDVRTVWETDYGTVRLFKEIGKGKGYAHPKEFYEDEMRLILSSLYYAQYEYFHWTRESRVFEEGQLGSIARPFQDAFLKAGQDDVVEFYFVARTRKVLGIVGERRALRGKAFIQGEYMNVMFDQMYQVLSESPSATEDQVQYSSQVAWKLVPMKGQSYGVEKDAVGKEREDQHWIRIDLREVLSAHPEAGGAHPPTAAGVPPQKEAPRVKDAGKELSAKDKLEKLNEMLKEGLITQEDYDLKKKEILEGF